MKMDQYNNIKNDIYEKTTKTLIPGSFGYI